MKPLNQERITTFKTKTQVGARKLARSALLCAGIALSACTTLGTGTGSVSPGGTPVAFEWKSTDGGITGTMSATLPDGNAFSGPYAQGTGEVATQNYDPIWAGSASNWGDWGPFSMIPQAGFSTLYSGRVTADLQAADGQSMRCQFQLKSPIDGMTGGGQGECRLKNGRSVAAVFPKV